jgi:hypothetical protein
MPFVIDTKKLIISLTLNSNLFHVFPGDKRPILPEELAATTNSKDNVIIPEFFIDRTPEHGNLVDKSGRILAKFNQLDIENGNIFYQAKKDQPAWTTVDFFTFSVKAGPSDPIRQKSFYIQISYNRDGRPSLQTLNPVIVQEGGKAFVNLTIVDASNFFKKLDSLQSVGDYELEYRILTIPKRGELYLGKRLQREKYEFTQEDLAKNRISYHHDHSDYSTDNFELSTALVDLRYENVPKILDIRYNITIIVEGVNDNPPKLVKNHQLIQIVQGSHHKITTDDFAVEDKDGDEIFIEIISPSPLGEFVHKDNRTHILKLFSNKGNSFHATFFFILFL